MDLNLFCDNIRFNTQAQEWTKCINILRNNPHKHLPNFKTIVLWSLEFKLVFGGSLLKV
jgi:hypothetical protein